MLKLVQNILFDGNSEKNEVRPSILLRTIDLSIVVVSVVLLVMAVKLIF